MIHDQELLDRLSEYERVRFSDVVYRATRMSLDPLTPSLAGGRWMPPDQMPVLYTSRAREGALAEISFHLSLLNPIPRKEMAVHTIQASAGSTLRLLRGNLVDLGVDWAGYQGLEYAHCQSIGAAAAFLECDGLLVPSARWECENLILFMNNHRLDEKLDVLESKSVDWVEWALGNGILPPTTM